MNGIAVTSAVSNLFVVRGDMDKLDDADANTYHRLTAKLLYLCKQAQPDLQTAVAFLTIQVIQPDADNWKKLARVVRYLRGSKDLYLTLKADDGTTIKRWIDASFAVHPDMRSHTGGNLSLGKGSVYCVLHVKGTTD
jgi:hypothetical protein